MCGSFEYMHLAVTLNHQSSDVALLFLWRAKSPYPPVPVSPGAPTYRSPPWCTMAQPSMVPVSGLGPASCTMVLLSRVKLVTSTGIRRLSGRGQDIATVMIDRRCDTVL